MPIIQITTDRLPQPERSKGALLNVSEEKAASLVAQGFAKMVEAQEPKGPKRGRPRKKATSDD